MATPAPASTFSISQLFHPDKLGDMITGAVLILIGWLLARFFAKVFERSMQHRITSHQLIVWRRVIYHGILILFSIAALREMGFHLSVLLGAAGAKTRKRLD